MNLPSQTFESIMTRMLSRIPSNFDKREGSIIWDALAPAALELESLYFVLEGIIQENNVLQCSRQSLIYKAIERGLAPIPASKAIIEVKFNIPVSIGKHFQYKNLIYVVIEKSRDDNYYKLECTTVGANGNISSGSMLNLDKIDGLSSAEIQQVLVYGRDEEETEVFRQRYLKSFTEQAYGGNITDYEVKTLSISGVGSVKVTPVPNNEGGTVKVTILDSEFNKANTELIQKVKDTLDPEVSSGKGKGVAPIGHRVTVDTVTERVINIQIRPVFRNNDTFEKRKEEIKNVINEYFLELKKDWARKDINLSIINIQAKLLAKIQNLEDITSFTLNGGTTNILLNEFTIPKLGTVNSI